MSIASLARRSVLTVAVASAAALAAWPDRSLAAAVTNTWIGGATGDYGVDGNWSQSRVPGTGAPTIDAALIGGASSLSLADDLSTYAAYVDKLTVNDDATITINNGGNVTITQSTWDHGWLRLGDSGSGHVVMNGGTLDFKVPMLSNSSTLTMNGGTFYSHERKSEIGRTSDQTATITLGAGDVILGGGSAFGLNGGTGIVNMTGGRLASLYSTTVGDANSTGTLNISGGEAWIGIPSIGNNAGSSGGINIFGNGILNISREINIGAEGNGAITLSGSASLQGNSVTPWGSIQYGRGIESLTIGNGTAGSGLFKIVGNDVTANVHRTTGTVSFTLGANGTLAFDIDDATVSSLDLSTGGVATLSGTIDLGLIGGYTPVTGMVYNLLTGAKTITDSGMSLAAGDAANWSLSIIGTAGAGQTLQATYVPEPTSLALLGLGALALPLRRRRVRPSLQR